MKTKVIVSIALFAFALIGCAKKDSDVIKIGAVLPLTGSSALLGKLANNGLDLAAADINSTGGVAGKKIMVILEDGKADPSTSISAFQKLIDVDKVKYVVTSHSTVGLALSSIADKNKVILFVHASHPLITGKSVYVFRHSNVAEQESQMINDFLVNRSNKSTVSIAALNDDYGIVFRDKLKELFLKNSVSFTGDYLYDNTESDFKTLAHKLITIQHPNVVILAGLGQNVGQIIKRLREFGYKGDILVTLGAFITGAFDVSGEASKGVFYIDFAFDSKDKKYQELSNRYSKKFNSDMQSSSLLFYNTLQLLRHTIDEVGDDAFKVSEGLKRMRQFNGVGEEMTFVNSYDIVPALKILKK
jgi:branched-chain amino acid transport system substrate-binding protein